MSIYSCVFEDAGCVLHVSLFTLRARVRSKSRVDGKDVCCVRHHACHMVSPWVDVGMFTSQGGQLYFRPPGPFQDLAGCFACTIGPGSHMVQLCFHVNIFTMLSGKLCYTSSPLGPFYKLGVFLVFTTPWGWVSNVFSLALCQSVYVAKWET
jgi:hypothetical protein